MWLRYPKDQHLGFLFSKEIKYEENIRRKILPYIKPGSLVFEIGSNIGQYTLNLSEHLGAGGQLIAIEPDHDNFSLLALNCEINHCHNVTLVCKAVSNTEGVVRFFKDTVTGGRTGSLVEKYTGVSYKGHWEEVQTTTYNQLIATYGIPHFVKVDAEGAEEFIFTPSTIIHPSTTYFIEVRTETANAIYNRFKSEGFAVYQIDHGMTEIPDQSAIKGLANLLMYKKQ